MASKRPRDNPIQRAIFIIPSHPEDNEGVIVAILESQKADFVAEKLEEWKYVDTETFMPKRIIKEDLICLFWLVMGITGKVALVAPDEDHYLVLKETFGNLVSLAQEFTIVRNLYENPQKEAGIYASEFQYN